MLTKNSMKNKILVIFTGGTIGSLARCGVIDVDKSTRYALLERFSQETGEAYDQFDVSYPLNLLSENLIPSDWNKIVDEIRSKDLSNYEGVIVTHGTDTLPYTSAVLSFIFNQIRIPLVVVASDLPVDNPASNGITNFMGAVDFIRSKITSGVFVIYRNTGEEIKVHLGSRITEAFPFTHQFRSQKNAFFGTLVNKKFVFNRAHKFTPEHVEDINLRTGISIGNVSFSDEVMLIKPYPGLNYDLLDFSKIKPKAILHDLYHSGTACVREEQKGKYSIVEFAKRCTNQGIDFYVAPLSASIDSVYITSHELLACNVIPLPDMSIEACIAKLSIAYGHQSSIEAKKFLVESELFFEFITPSVAQ